MKFCTVQIAALALAFGASAAPSLARRAEDLDIRSGPDDNSVIRAAVTLEARRIPSLVKREDSDDASGNKGSAENESNDGEGDDDRKKPSDKKPSDEKPSDEKPSDKKPSDEKPSDEKPSDKKPSDEKPSDEKPSDEKPSDEKPSDKKPSDEKPSDEKPSDKKPSDEKPSDEKPSDEKPTDEQPGKYGPRPIDGGGSGGGGQGECDEDGDGGDKNPGQPGGGYPADPQPEKPEIGYPADPQPEKPDVGYPADPQPEQPKTTVPPSGGYPARPGGVPDAHGTTPLAATQTIAPGETFDGGMAMFDRGVPCTGQVEGGSADAVFLIQAGGTLSNVIIGPNQLEGVHCEGACSLIGVWWTAVCEDAFTIKVQAENEVTTITGGGAFGAADKILQHNGAGTLQVTDFTAGGFQTFWRACGNCKVSHHRHVVISGLNAVDGDTICGLNTNFGDTCVISNSEVSSIKETCKLFEGVEKGSEPNLIGSGPDGVNCIVE